MTPAEVIAKQATQTALRGIIARAGEKGELRCVRLSSDDGSIHRVKFQKDPRHAMLREILELPDVDPQTAERDEVRIAENCTTCGLRVGEGCGGGRQAIDCHRGSHWILREK